MVAMVNLRLWYQGLGSVDRVNKKERCCYAIQLENGEIPRSVTQCA